MHTGAIARERLARSWLQFAQILRGCRQFSRGLHASCPFSLPPSIDIYYLSILTSFLRSSTFVFLSIRVTSWNWNIYICVKRQDWSEDLKFLVLSTSPIFWLRVVSDRPKEVIKIDILGETFTYEFTLLFISLPFQEVYMYMYRHFFSARQIVRNSKNKPASLHLL